MKKRNLLAAGLSGLILALAMPRPGIWLLAWMGLAPMLVSLCRARARDAAAYGFVTGVVYFGVIVFWISLFGYLPWALVTLVEALFLAFFAAAAAMLMPCRIGGIGYLAVPAAWTPVQWARSLGPYAFTWGSLAHTQASNLPVAQIASVTGPWGIDFLVCLVNLAIAEWLMSNRKKHVPLVIAAIALVCVIWQISEVGLVALSAASDSESRTKVAVIQGNVSQDVVPTPDYLGQTFQIYQHMSREAAHKGVDLIIWPETTLPANIGANGWGDIASRLAAQTHANYVIGAYDAAEAPTVIESYNSAYFYDRKGGKLGVYHKVQLVPFGEFVPLRGRLPWLSRYGIRDIDVLPGRSHNLVKTDVGTVGVSICFESLFPQISRVETACGASLLLVITDDAWFGRTQAARGHLMMSKLRAIENRRFLIRGAATGISTVIDPYGNSLAELGIFRRGIVTAQVTSMDALTLYTRFGDYFAYLCILIAGLAILCVSRSRTGRQ